MDNKIIIYTDGGSRGNPGPSAIGVYIPDKNKMYKKFIGEQTNNIAEYSAVIFALKKIKQIIGKDKAKNSLIEIRSDSELVIKQLNAKYKLKNKSLYEYFIEIWNLKQDFKNVIFMHIPREKNNIADKLVNEALDEALKPKLFN